MKSKLIDKNIGPNEALVESNQHELNDVVKAHSHPVPSLIYIVGGGGKGVVNGEEYELSQGGFLFISAYADHEISSNKGTPLVVFVVFWGEQASVLSQENLKSLFDGGSFSFGENHARQARGILRNMLHEQKYQTLAYQAALRTSLSQLLLLCLRHKELNVINQGLNSEQRVAKVLADIEKNYHIETTSVEAAKLAKLSQRQFSSLCRKLSNKNFIRFIHSVRIKKALEYLENTKIPVTTIAFEVGYEDLSTFYRAFKNHTGKQPTSYRGKIRKIL
ncbi:MAG: helix-turn-helix transcriptional regulator [Planctomycetes bacterium]|nr:helix-turn-helix transcriptional regulator [Planctomycetota bacterium]